MVLNTNLLAVENEDAQELFNQAQFASRAGDHVKAVEGFTKLLALKPTEQDRAAVLQRRGESYFKLAKIKESITDFDAYLKIRPKQDPYHWQRGISYYYANEFKKGHCLARAKGIKEAKKKLIPIVGDGRIPMMEVHALFGGNSTPEKVLAKARGDEVKGARLERQLFYAHLYLGIWHETKNELKLRNKYIALAAAVADNHGYMGDVARVHAVLNKIKVPKSQK